MALLNDDWTPKQGEHFLEVPELDARFGPVACLEHSTQVEVEAGQVEREGDGYQPNCEECSMTVGALRDHVNQVGRGI